MTNSDLFHCDQVALAILQGTADRTMVQSLVDKYAHYRKKLTGPVLAEAVYRVLRKRERHAKTIAKMPSFVNRDYREDPLYRALTDAVVSNGFSISYKNVVRPISEYYGEQLEVSFEAPWTVNEAAEAHWERVDFSLESVMNE